MNQLELSLKNTKEYTITDQAWHDPTTGFFKRIMKRDNQIIMANAWDGASIYEIFSENNEMKTIIEPVQNSFSAPINPAEFLGLSVGVCGIISKAHHFHQQYEDELEDGTPVTVYAMGYPDQQGNMPTYWLFKVDHLAEHLAELEFVIEGNTFMRMKRVLTEKLETAPTSWALENIKAERPTESNNSASMNADMFIENISVTHMKEKASYPTFLFSQNPDWCDKRIIYDAVDPPSPGHRMFLTIYSNQQSKKHVLFIQSKTYNGMFVQFFEKDVNGDHALVKSGKYRIYDGGPQAKWWTKVVLDTIQIPADDQRNGYILWTGTETIPALVINGPTTKEELKELLDSLVTSEEYLETVKE